MNDPELSADPAPEPTPEPAPTLTVAQLLARRPVATVADLAAALDCTIAEAHSLARQYVGRLAHDLGPALARMRQAEVDRDVQAMQRAIAVEARERQARSYPSADDDILVVTCAKYGQRLPSKGGEVTAVSGRLCQWLTSALLAEVRAAVENEPFALDRKYKWFNPHREELRSRKLLICAERMPDLREMLRAAFLDDLTHGCPEKPNYSEALARTDELFVGIIAETTDLATLRAWLGAALLHDVPASVGVVDDYDAARRALSADAQLLVDRVASLTGVDAREVIASLSSGQEL
jgi:hypothetical protein